MAAYTCVRWKRHPFKVFNASKPIVYHQTKRNKQVYKISPFILPWLCLPISLPIVSVRNVVSHTLQWVWSSWQIVTLTLTTINLIFSSHQFHVKCWCCKTIGLSKYTYKYRWFWGDKFNCWAISPGVHRFNSTAVIRVHADKFVERCVPVFRNSASPTFLFDDFCLSSKRNSWKCQMSGLTKFHIILCNIYIFVIVEFTLVNDLKSHSLSTVVAHNYKQGYSDHYCID